jgi:thermitase
VEVFKLKFKLLLSVAIAAVGAAMATASEHYVPGEVLVKFKSGSFFHQDTAHRRIFARPVQEFKQIGVQRIQLPRHMTVERAVEYYKQLPNVAYAEPNYKKQLIFRPNDPNYNQQWSFVNMQAELGWAMTLGDPDVIIAIIDTGVQLNHPDLESKLVPGYNFSENNNNADDYHGHGTHCAGIAAAATNNGVGVAGIGFNSRIMPIKIFPNATISAVTGAVTFAADNGAKVLSMSYGGYFYSQTEFDALEYASNKGCVLVAGAGNDNVDERFYPAAYNHVIAVGSTNQQDQKSDFSQFGNWVDVAAPGSNIYSTMRGSTYSYSSGTSMSTPQVAGLAALIVAQAGLDIEPAEVRNIIESSTDPVGNWVKTGRVNAYKALLNVIPPIGFEAQVEDVSMFVGSSAFGDATVLHNFDQQRYVLNSTTSPLGQVAGAEVLMNLGAPNGDLIRLNLEVVAAGPRGSTGMIWLYNWNNGQYEFYRAFPIQEEEVIRFFPIDHTGPYVGSEGHIKFITRAHKGTRFNPHIPFTYYINHVKLSGAVRPPRN